MKKLDWSTVMEITIAIILGGIIVAALHAAFGGWLAKFGAELHGLSPQGTPAK